MLRADGRSKSIEVSLGELESEKIQRYSHEHLTKFTRNFTFPLGSGAYGDVFKGQLPNGEQVAVKVLKNIASDALEYTFMAELSTMSSTSHRNLVRLYGYCFEANMKALVFEYMKNGSFDRVLYENHLNLQWEKLYDIATETAKALSYLHESCRKVIIHYDVKAGNVLLDSDHSPKVADFGLAKVSKRDVSHISVIQFRGTRGFAAPEMWMQMPVTYKSDVYSFGMLLFEVLGRRRICEGEDWFPGQVWDMFEKKQLDKLIEGCRIEEKNKEKAKTLSTVALWCTQHSPDKRPTMSLVVQVLEGNIQLRPPPNPQYPYCVSSVASSIYNWIDGSTSISGPPPSPVSSIGFHSSDKRLDVAEQSGEVLSGSVSAEILSRENIGNSVASPNASTDWNAALDMISFGSPEQSVEGIKVVCHELAQATDDPENTAIENLIKDADKLVLCLAIKVPKTFDFILTGGSSRSCKYVLNTLMQTFQNKKLAHGVKESTLHSLITELLLFLLDEKILLIDDGAQILKASNVLMLKILDNSERTLSFVVLINLLRPLDPSRLPSPASTESAVTINQKFSDLVVKCLIKLTKVLQSTIHEVDLDRILQSIHVYMQELGMEEIRKRAGADDKPLRMVKTILHELCKLRGTAIKGHLSMVPTDMEPQPIVLAYIDLNLQTLASAGMLTPTDPVGQTHSGDSANTSPSPAKHSAYAQLKVDIFSQLQNASEAFRASNSGTFPIKHRKVIMKAFRSCRSLVS